MEIDRNLRLYNSDSDTSSSYSGGDGNDADGCTTDTESDEDSEESSVDIFNCDKRQNILFKLYNRERYGNFTNSPSKFGKELAYKEVPKRLSFCLKEIVPYCYLKDHVFMGLTVCGQFLLSYKVSYNDESNANMASIFNWNAELKYELYFWIFRPHKLLGKYYKVCLFDDHGVQNYKVVTTTQWRSNPRTLIVHGASEEDEGTSHITVVAVPKLGCLDCAELRDEYSDDHFRCDALCIRCNLTIHTKYSRNDSDPKFVPELNLSCPNFIIMNGNGFIHVVNIDLDVPKVSKGQPMLSSTSSSSASMMMIQCLDGLYFRQSTVNDNPMVVPSSSSYGNGCGSFVPSNTHQNLFDDSGGGGGGVHLKRLSHIENHHKVVSTVPSVLPVHHQLEERNRNGCENYSNINSSGNSNRSGNTSSSTKNSIVDNIIADFAECETSECNIGGGVGGGGASGSGGGVGVKLIEELVITCSSSIPVVESTSSAPSGTGIITGTNGARRSNEHEENLHHHNHKKIDRYSNLSNLNKFKNRIRMNRSIFQLTPVVQCVAVPGTPVESTTVTTTSSNHQESTSPTSTESVDNSASSSSKQIYEFSEDTEKCEKISIFRKRRLADKKYEFSDYNSENIMPFQINLRKRTRGVAVSTATSAAPVSATPISNHHSSQPYTTATTLSCGLFNPAPPNYEVTSHLHRVSPSHGFHSPCGSPVGNRCLRSPPGYTKPTYLSSCSPTYQIRSSPSNATTAATTTTSSLTLSPRPQPTKRSNLESVENTLNHYHGGFQSPSRPPLQTSADEHNHSKSNNTVGVQTNAHQEQLDTDKPPVCSKKFVRRFVEEDDATSVITSEEDDCISPGYHTSLPMEVHGSCYSDMQMISAANYQKLKCPTVIVTQNSFDLETFTFHVGNHLCNANNKKYDIFYDWACELVYVCPISCNITLLLMVHFTARDQPIGIDTKKCKHYQSQSLFTWNIESGDWTVLDYGELKEVASSKQNFGKLNAIAHETAAEMASQFCGNLKIFNHLKVLDSCNEKSKDLLKDLENSIEFYRHSKKITLRDID